VITLDLVRSSTPRQRQALATRERIRDAGRELFLARGFAAATVVDIARAAGVAPQTIYFSYGTKAAVLSAIIDAEIVGDLEPIPLLERPAVRRLAKAADPTNRLGRAVSLLCDVTERVAPLYEIARSGATDPEVGALLDRHERERRQTHRALIDLVVGDLQDGVGAEEAADRLYALVSHDVYWLLVRRCGWPSQRWRRYSRREAARQLLPPSHARRA
jgi:AcrR family transcriptional regulator